MKTGLIYLFFLLTGLFLCGCHGVLYTNCTYPLSRDFHETPVGNKAVETHRHKLKEPFSGYGFNITVSTGELDKLTKEAGMEAGYYADQKVVSFLFGLYERKTVIVYGE